MVSGPWGLAGVGCRVRSPPANGRTRAAAAGARASTGEAGWVLAAGGYDAFLANGAGLANLTGTLKTSVFALNSYIPLAMFVLIFLLLFKYDYEEKLPEIIKDNERIEAELLANNQ